MKFLKIGLFVSLVVAANAGKVTWDENGKPIIAQSDKPVKGCNYRGFEAIIEDNNSSKCSS